MDRVDALVVGAGVVGLAVARELARGGHEVVVVDREAAIGTVTSARNSEVLHAGLYYATGSAKAELCVRGRELLVRYCAEHGVAHRLCGKLVVATQPGELTALQGLLVVAHANGVEDARLIDGAAARAREPALHAVAALESPSTGIVDSHGLMLALRGDAEDAGAMFAFLSPFERATVTPDGFEVHIGGDEPMRIGARWLVNAAGLHASTVANAIEGLGPSHVPATHRCKGQYFALSGRAPFSRLIYPMHDRAGLGVHFTLDLGGQGRFGPDVQWLPDDAPDDYEVDASRAEAFARDVRRYWPALPDGVLVPAYSGLRPKIVREGEPAADFVIDGPQAHGVPGLVNLFGIESPGLTACLAIAERAATALR